jgi:hypothetical protein
MAGKKRRVFSSTVWLQHLMCATDDELWVILQNLRQARLLDPRSPLPKPYRPEAWKLLAAQWYAELNPPESPNRPPRDDIEYRIMMEEPWSRAQVRRMRWLFFSEGIERKGWGGKVAGRDAGDYASAALAGSPAEGGWRVMREDYDAEQKRLRPSGQERPRTWKRKRRALRQSSR